MAYNYLKRGIVRIFKTLQTADYILLVGSLSFTTAFALIPTFILMLAVVQFMGDLGLVLESFRPDLLTYLGFTPKVIQQLTSSLKEIEFSKIGIFGFLGLIYASSDLIFSFDSAIHRVWKERGHRWPWKRMLVYWGILFLFPLATSLYLAIFSYEIINSIMIYPQKVLPMTGWTLGLLLINKYAPYEVVKWKAAIISAVAASLCLWVLQAFFFWANGAIFNYNRLYGSLAFLPLLLISIRLMWLVVLGSVILCQGIHKAA